MTVANSKQIRRRIAQAERQMFALKRRPAQRARLVPSQAEVERVIEIHNQSMGAAIERGDAVFAGWYARQAVSYWKAFRALSIARDHNCAVWKGFDCAKHELFNCELALLALKD